MRFVVRGTAQAEVGLNRLFDALLERATTADDFDRALWPVRAIRSAIEGLSDAEPRCRKAGNGHDPFLRELVIPFGRTGHLAPFELAGDAVVVAAIRHRLEDDYH